MDCLQEQQLPGTPVNAPLGPAVIGKGDSLSLPGCEGPQDAAASWDGFTFRQDLCFIVYFLIVQHFHMCLQNSDRGLRELL